MIENCKQAQLLATFPNARSVVPMLWAFATLAMCELLAMHLLMSLVWPSLAWPLTALTAASFFWLVAWIKSWRRLPHELYDDRLLLHMGSLRSVEIPLGLIKNIEHDFTSSTLKAQGVQNLVPIAFPNRLIRLNSRLPGKKAVDSIAIKLDEPDAFDKAMASTQACREYQSPPAKLNEKR